MDQIVLEPADTEGVQTPSGRLELPAEVEEAHLPLLDGLGGGGGGRRRGRRGGEGDQRGTLGGDGRLEGVQGGREGQRYLLCRVRSSGGGVLMRGNLNQGVQQDGRINHYWHGQTRRLFNQILLLHAVDQNQPTNTAHLLTSPSAVLRTVMLTSFVIFACWVDFRSSVYWNLN